MPETPKPKKKLQAVAPRKVKIQSSSISYPCALCGKSQVAWTIIGEGVINIPGYITVSLRHSVCNQEITLDIKAEKLAVEEEQAKEEGG